MTRQLSQLQPGFSTQGTQAGWNVNQSEFSLICAANNMLLVRKQFQKLSPFGTFAVSTEQAEQGWDPALEATMCLKS